MKRLAGLKLNYHLQTIQFFDSLCTSTMTRSSSHRHRRLHRYLQDTRLPDKIWYKVHVEPKAYIKNHSIKSSQRL